MFQPQFSQLQSALRAAGLGADAATAIARVLTNPQQTGRSGPVEVDTTPRNMRKVTPDARKYTLPNLDFKEGDPYHRPNRIATSEEQPEPEQPPAVQVALAHQQVNNIAFNVAPGGFANAVPRGKAVEVGMRIKGPDRSVATLDTVSSSLVGKRIRAEAAANTGLRFFIEDTGQELVWKLQAIPQEEEQVVVVDPPACESRIDVVTDVRLEEEGLVVEKRTLTVCYVLDPPTTSTIPTDDCPQE